MSRTVTLQLEIPDGIRDPGDARRIMAGAVSAMGEEEIREILGPDPQAPLFFHVHAIPNDEGGAPTEVFGPDVRRISVEDFRTLSNEDQRAFAYTFEQASAAPSSTWAYWVREDLMEEEPVLAFVSSTDGHFCRNLDIRPCLLAAKAEKLAEAINSEFEDASDKRAILAVLEQKYDPTAEKLSNYLVGFDDESEYDIEIDTEAVREWAMRERPEVGYALINAPGPK